MNTHSYFPLCMSFNHVIVPIFKTEVCFTVSKIMKKKDFADDINMQQRGTTL